MFQHVLSSNAGTIQEFFIPFYRSIGRVKISIGFYEIQCKYVKEHVNNIGLVIPLAIFLRVSKRTKWWNKINNGFPSGWENVIKIKSEQIVAVISDWIWKYQKLSSDTNAIKAGKQTSKCKQQGNLFCVDLCSITRQWKLINGSGVINVHFKPTQGTQTIYPQFINASCKNLLLFGPIMQSNEIIWTSHDYVKSCRFRDVWL